MAVSLKHAFTSSIPDDTDTSLVRPSNWNAEHNLTLAASSLLGRATASAGSAEEIPPGSGLTLDTTGLIAKASTVKVASTANVATLSGAQTVDGVSLVAGDRVLLKNQTTLSANGIYVVSASSWSRAPDANTATKIASTVVMVEQGTSGGQLWHTTFKSTDTLGTTSMNWYQVFDSAQTITVPNGGTGATTFTSGALLKGAGASAITTATAGTDYVAPGTATSGKIIAAASTTGAASVQIPTATAAPTSAASGDLWNATGVLTFNNGSANKSIAFTDSNITGNAANVTGVVALANGGTNANLTAANGGVVYSSGTAMAITAAGSSGQALVSSGAAAPAWTTLSLENVPGAWVKENVRVATTAAITLSGTQTIDGVAVAAADRVLVKDQGTASANGIYVVAAGAWSRAADADASAELAGAMVAVDSGTTNGGKQFYTTFKSTDTLGTTAMTWADANAASSGVTSFSTGSTGLLANSVSTAVTGAVSLSGTLGAGFGGTGQSTYTTGDLLYASGSTALSKLAAPAAGQVLISNGTTTAPSWSATPLVTSVDIGNADTTISRSAAGVIAVEGVVIPSISSTNTLTNKRITPRISSTASITSPLAWNSDNFDQYAATAQAAAFTISADAGTPTDGQKMVFRFKDNGTGRVITFTGGVSKGFRPVGVTLTASGSNWTYTTTASKTVYFGCIYNGADLRWDVIALSAEA